MSEHDILAQLAAQEDGLIAQLRAVANEPDQVVFKNIHATVSQLYKAIYHEYVALLESTSDAAVYLEALKRTVFLRWYVMTEPDWHTGIGYIDTKDTARVFNALEDVIIRARLDYELGWMLAYYAQWDFALQPINGENGFWPHITAFLHERTALSQVAPNYSAVPPYVEPGTIAGRGQLSTYWLSIINR